MVRNLIKYSLSLGVAVLFLWLAFRNVRFGEIGEAMGSISYWWVIPTAICMMISHYLRAERWRLFLEEKSYNSHRLTLFSGVMIGYLVNYAFPRMGEVSRCIYVGKREEQSASSLLGTVVLERILDLLILVAIMVVVAVYIIADLSVLTQLFGENTIEYLNNLLSWDQALQLFGYVLAIAAVLVVCGYGLVRLAKRIRPLARILNRVQELIRLFIEGIIAIKNVDNWGLFLLQTVLIWVGYIAMSYFPLWMLNLHTAYDIGWIDAIAITAIISIGIVLPSPGGVGTYHYFAKQALLVLFAVPASIGLTYAVITHAMLMLMVIISTAIVVFLDRKVHGTSELDSLWDVVDSPEQKSTGN